MIAIPFAKPLTAGALALALALLAGCGRKTADQPKAEGDEFPRLTTIARGLLENGDAAKSVETLQRALALNPAHPDAHLNLAVASLAANQPSNVLVHAGEVIQQNPNSAAAHYVLGCAWLRLGQFEKALQSLQQASDLDPNVAAVSFQLGVAHQALNHVEDAIAAYQGAIALEPDHLAAHYRLGQVLLRAGQKDEANAEMEKHRVIAAKRAGMPSDTSVFEQCKFTQLVLPFKLEQPAPDGVKVQFVDATATMLPGATNFHGPIAVLDLNHTGTNSLFVLEGTNGFRLLENAGGRFTPRGPALPAISGARYQRALVAELHQDRFEDVIMLGDRGSHVFKFVTNAGITEVTRLAGMTNLAAADGALVDLDFTGKLDLLALQSDGTRARSFRNLGNFFFRENTATSGLPATLTGARQIVLDDWNNDDLADVFIARDGQSPLLLTKTRGGPLTATNSPGDWPVGGVIAVGDLNNDLRPDLAVVTPDAIEIVFNEMTNRAKVPLGGFKPVALYLVDYDNDGWLDLVATGDGVRVWRNRGLAGFHDATAELGLDKLAPGTIDGVAFADFDSDGDTDFILSRATGLQVLRNDGGNTNHQLKLLLVGHRSNPSGLGIRLMLTTGGLRLARTVNQLPVEIGLGKYTSADSLTARWFDLAVNSVDLKADPKQPIVLEELVLPTGSCPYLYAWDGRTFRFVTDLLGAAPAGLHVSDKRLVDADPFEHVWIGNEAMFPPRDGSYVLQITEELREVLYLDEAKLIVVDHPAGTEIHPTSKMMPGRPFPNTGLVTLNARRPLLKATNHEGTDVTARLQEIDQQFVSPTKLRASQLRGLAEPHSVTLDFGPLPVERPLVLALTGWIRFGGGMANVGGSHNPELPFPFPQLEVETAAGEWRPVDVTVGVPAGKTKTILVDLAGKLPSDARRLRLGAAFELHWDRIALFEKRDNTETRLTTLAPTGTDLHWRGFSPFQEQPSYLPLTPDYNRVISRANWRITPMGWCTRYGAADELIATTDNGLCLINGGDELTLSFATDRVPAKPAGAQREFFLYSVGWDKDSDFHCEAGWLVEPLPWHGMNDQLYGHEPRPAFPSDALHAKYNTRWVGQETLARAQRR